jgi:endonuclease YncB( thermonuclease family)
MNEPMSRETMNNAVFAREYLKDHEEREASPFVIGLSAAAIAGGGFLAYKKGALKPVAEQIIKGLGNYRNTEMGAAIKGFRNWTERENNGGTWRYQMEMLRLDIEHARGAQQRRMAKMADSPFITDRPGELMDMVTQRNNTLRDLDRRWNVLDTTQRDSILNQYQTKENWIAAFQNQIDNHIRERNNVTASEQMEKVKQTGYRFATLNDVFDHLDENQRILLERAQKSIDLQGNSFKMMEKIYDKNLLINDKTGDFADLRDFQAMAGGVLDTIADDFTTPFVKINPMRMLYLNKFSAVNKAPEFKVLSGNTRQPALTSNQDALGTDHVYIGGNVFKVTDPTKAAAENVRLVDGKAGPVARYYRNLSGLTTSKYREPSEGLWNKFKWNAGSLFKVGFQDEPIGRDISWNFTRGNNPIEMPNMLDPTTWPSWMAQKAHNQLKPYQGVSRIKLEDAFGAEADWIVFNNFKTYEQAGGLKNFSKQFVAGRDNMEDVTTATLFPYGFFERLNSTLNQLGLGLPNDSLGSAFEVAKNLMLYRIAPAIVAVEGWKYMNTVSEDFLGFQFEDKFAEFYAGASTDVAGVRDSLGITDWAKDMAWLMPGGEQIADLPFVGHFMDWNDSEEETRAYWESGEEAVRKGRFWETGNTAFTGGKIEYFEPNWVRKTLSDYEFTDTMYGSRDEYFENHWLPTPTNPLAPVRHFITDPYHWEEKHYYDRPYLVTGSQFEEFPLIGPALGATVGQIFKPSRMMHEEYWLSLKPEEGLVIPNVDGSLQNPRFDDVSDDVPIDPTQILADQAAGDYMDYNTFEVVDRNINTFGQNNRNAIAAERLQQNGVVHKTPEPDKSYAGYITPAGDITPVAVEETKYDTINSINRRIKEKALAKAAGDASAEPIRMPDGTPQFWGTESVISPHSAQNTISNLYYNLTEMGGMYGFMTATVAGEVEPGNVMASSNEMTSMSRNFWDMNIGNLGGDANEIFRRFLPRDADIGKGYNPVPNQMPSWMPGEEYFTNFQTGDPYTKIRKGEMRLPGESYEVLYGIDSAEVDEHMEMNIGASGIGYDTAHIVNQMLRRDEVEDEDAKFVTETGTDWHVDWEERMMKDGIGLDKEQYVKNEELGISGFYDVKADHAKWLEYAAENAEVFKFYDNSSLQAGGSERFGGFYDNPIDINAMRKENPEEFKQFIRDSLEGAPMALLDPKTMSDKKYSEEEMFFYNAQQVNFYLHETGQKRGYLIHVNRDEIGADGKEAGIQVHAFDYNPELLNYSVSKVESARQHIRQGLQDGSYGRGDFYDMIDQYRILSDVAPHSQQYRDMKTKIRQWKDLTEEDRLELQEIDDQGAARKENVRMYPYRFKTADVTRQQVTVTKVIDNNTFMTEEFENPIKLAGLRAPTGKDDPLAAKAADILNLSPGRRITIAINADEQNRINNDTYKTMSAVVYNGNVNVNRQLIESGIAKEKENDFTPTGVHARFSSQEIGFGALWESVAHLDNPFNTKFLQVRSPLESYERREVYNKDWQEWQDPVDDFFIPWYQNIIRKEPVIALVAGTWLGSQFGNTKFGKISGALIGLAAAAAGTAYVGMYNEISGERWVPERREREWEAQEYLDTLKYVKFRRLFEWQADKALQHEGVDVRQMIADRKEDAEFGKSEKAYLQDLKRRIHKGTGRELQDAINEATEYIEDNYSYIMQSAEGDISRAINMRLEELANDRELLEMGPMTARALTYYQQSEKTMYAYDPGEPLQNFLAGLPKKDRDYLVPFMQAPEEERDDILEVVPDYLKRVLQASYGMEVDEKPDLVDYFTTHGLPDRDWMGWDDRASLNDVKVKMVKKEKLDPSEFEIWPQDEAQAAKANIDAPNMNARNSESEVRRKLEDILKGIGLQDVQVNVTQGGGNSHVNMNVQVDRRSEIVRQMNEDAINLV